ncbi:hypothetical protein, partial [Mycobacterium tuberculosis]
GAGGAATGDGATGGAGGFGGAGAGIANFLGFSVLH